MNYIDELNRMLEKPKESDFEALFSELNLFLLAGSSLTDAIEESAKYQENLTLKDALKNIARSLHTGVSAASAFNREGIFPKIVAPTIEAGETAGNLSGTFDKLRALMEMQSTLYGKVKSAMFVPKVAAVLSVLLVLGYVKIAMPQYIQLYEESGTEMPGFVLAVVNAVNAVFDYWYVTVLVIFGGYKLFTRFCNNYAFMVDSWKLKFPIYSKLHFNFLQHQFVSILSLMLASGITMQDALGKVAMAVDNAVMMQGIIDVKNDIYKGKEIAKSLEDNNEHRVFDPRLISAINAGDKSGDKITALNQIARYYERSIENSVETIGTKMTLIVMLPMGFLVVAMFFFTMIPMFDYLSKISQ